jgi:hypothetical protein
MIVRTVFRSRFFMELRIFESLVNETYFSIYYSTTSTWKSSQAHSRFGLVCVLTALEHQTEYDTAF